MPAFIEALTKEDVHKAAECLSEDMFFDDVMGKRNRSESYMNDMRKMKCKYEIKRTFENGDDVCLLYHIDMSGKACLFICG